MQYNFDDPVNRVGSNSYKWDTEGEAGRLIPLSVADTDFRSPLPVIEAVRKKAEFGIYGYATFPTHDFKAAIAGWYMRRYGLAVDAEAIRPAQGLMTGALWMLLLALTSQDDTILIQEPVYHNFRIVSENMGRKVISSDLKLNGGKYEIDWQDFEEKAGRSDTRVLVLCNPHNPVGRVWTSDELSRICEICSRNNVLIFSDEVHGDIVYKGHTHTPIISIPQAREISVSMSGPGKSFNLAGLYSSYVVIYNGAIRESYDKIYRQFHFDHNFIGTEALIAAYSKCDDYVDQQNRYLEGNISALKTFLTDNLPELQIIEPEGTYLLWLDCRRWKLTQNQLLNFFEDCGVRVNDGRMYGKGGEGFVRLNAATQRAVLIEALYRIRAGYSVWKANGQLGKID